MKALYSIVLWSFFLLFLLLADLLIPLIQLFTRSKKGIPFLWSKYLSKLLFALAFTKVKVTGLENIPLERPIIIMPNHQGHLDHAILFQALPFHFHIIGTGQYNSVPIIGRYLQIAEFYTLDREDITSVKYIFDKISEGLQNKESFVIYPEGTRTLDGSIGIFKGGGFILALKMGVPILPVAISGSFELLKKGTWLINPGVVKVKIGKPIYFPKKEQITSGFYNDAIKQVRAVIVDMYSELKNN